VWWAGWVIGFGVSYHDSSGLLANARVLAVTLTLCVYASSKTLFMSRCQAFLDFFLTIFELWTARRYPIPPVERYDAFAS
jgi:hypothetical protein